MNRGRIKNREVKVFNLPKYLSKVWTGVSQAVWIKREGKWSMENAYFISSFEGVIQLYAYDIRSHWSIENSLHWVKGVTLKENDSKIKSTNAPPNLFILRNCMLNVFRKGNMKEIAKNIRLLMIKK